jgi:hypothetical protein
VTAAFRSSAFTAGAALPWRFALPWAERLELLAGPRLSLVYLTRSFQGLTLVPTQSYLTMTPGVVGGVSWQLGRLTLGAEVQADFLLLNVNGQNRSSGFGELLLGAGWRF